MYCTDYNDLIIEDLYCIASVDFVFFIYRYESLFSATHSPNLTTNLKYRQRISLIMHKY